MIINDFKLGFEPRIKEDCTIKNAKFGKYVSIGERSRLLNSELGDYSYCDRCCDIANTIVGKFSNISSYVRIGSPHHPLNMATMHYFSYRSSIYFDDVDDDKDFFAHRESLVTNIGHDTWIGHGAVIKPQINIGHGAVVGASAVVTKDVAPYEIVAGVPAKTIKYRYDKKTSERMIKLQWWDWSHEKLQANLEDFRKLPAEEFLEKHSK